MVIGMQNKIWVQEIFLGFNRQYLMIYWILEEGLDTEKKMQFSI